jgi:enterochelin esterase-like enzyme
MPTATTYQVNNSTSTAAALPTPLGCWKEGGSLEVNSLATDLLRLPLDYRLYLPACYDQQPERRYPVLYLIHGQNYSDDQWDRLGADEAADRLIAAGEIPPLIIVMPRDRYGGQPSENNFARVIVEELRPFIDENYRTVEDREYRAVGGLSRGGGWAVHLAITQWEIFGALGAHSPAIFYDDAQRMRVYLDAIPSEAMPRIYMDIGDKDRPEIMGAALWFEELLNQRGIPHEWYLFSGYHAEDYWRDHLESYLRWYAKPW